MRTHQQMAAVYAGIGEQGKGNEPYVLNYVQNGRTLTFFGSIHSNDLECVAQWSAFDQSWGNFLEQFGPKVLVHENQLLTIESDSRDTAILTYGEIGLAMWSAQTADIESISGEPNRAEELEHLKQQFSEPEIMTYYFGRQMYQWLKQDYLTQPDWHLYAENCLEKYATVAGWHEELSMANALTWYIQTIGKQFAPKDEQTLFALSDPSVNPISSASGNFRDIWLLSLIESNWQADKNVFAVYGSGHAIVLEPALEHMIENTSIVKLPTD